MGAFGPLGFLLIILGILLVGAGLFLLFHPHIPFLGRLPGDFTFRWGRTTFFFPLASSLLISVILSLVLYLLRRR